MRLGLFAPDFTHRDRFRLHSFQNVFSEEIYSTLQKAFDQVDWKRKKDQFYEQYESFVKTGDPHAVLLDPSFFFPFKEKLEKQLGVEFQNYVRLAAHKLVTSDAIGLHNDYSHPEMGHENFRFIFQFAGDESVTGGELSFWASKYTKEIIRKYSYGRNCGVCFEITPYSFHSVEPVTGVRYTLVMYLWEKGRKVNDLAFLIT